MSEVQAEPLGEYPSRDLELVWDKAEADQAEAPLIPVELLFPHLPRKLFGYGRQATDAALERLAGEFRWLEQELRETRARAEALEAQVARIDEREWVISRAMTMAAETATSLEREAREAAQRILDEAREQAEDLIRETGAEISQLKGEASRLDELRSRTLDDLRGVLEELLHRVGGAPLNPQDCDVPAPTQPAAEAEPGLSLVPDEPDDERPAFAAD